MFNSSSSAFSSGSLNISHHFPLSAASCGRAGCQVSAGAPASAAGAVSLKAGAVATVGAAYLGPTTHPPSRTTQTAAAAQEILPAVLRTCVGMGGFAFMVPVESAN